MSMRYYRRFRMEIDITRVRLAVPKPADGYGLLQWSDDLVERHADVKYRSFRSDLDSQVFKCLGRIDGCLGLMREIVRQRTFLSGTTWLGTFHPDQDWPPQDCGTIQGIARSRKVGAIQ